MKMLLFAAPVLLSLSGCGFGAINTSAIPASPAAAAETTALDEQAALSVELAYKAARLVVETATDAGLIKGPLAARLAGYDAQAYRATLAVRAAYRAGNSANYITAIQEARSAIAAVLDAAKGDA